MGLAVDLEYLYNKFCPYKVGEILMTCNSGNPSTKYPNTTWQAWGSGRVPIGVNTGDGDFNYADRTGGEKIGRAHV
jgi:hypothetical protein